MPQGVVVQRDDFSASTTQARTNLLKHRDVSVLLLPPLRVLGWHHGGGTALGGLVARPLTHSGAGWQTIVEKMLFLTGQGLV